MKCERATEVILLVFDQFLYSETMCHTYILTENTDKEAKVKNYIAWHQNVSCNDG